MRAHAGFGRIERWDDARGFGFITPEASDADGPDRLFFHVRDFDRSGVRPDVGARVRYTPERQADGRWRAVHVAAIGTSQTPRAVRAASKRSDSRVPASAPAGGLRWLLPAIAIWCALLGFGLVSGRLPHLALAALAGLNVLTAAAYALDKHAAQRGRWRTRESHLHLLELLGGWPAAGLAQQALRHKRAKPVYRKVFAAMVVLHLLALGLWTFA
ncbi:DUF1294 domain-containing protein [Luteimonas terrae]|uniref:Uncharacterized membrane protein YsdA (DUF1294 family)/cold shock CspA family protein n=1 Tax=Luteimonas terrae TaxID=1530191 RepID=A0ABU1Y157_9GAMM|nr:DUF1294 domain-containing protein [Luteimonas terrae]MDR7194091.1 uncharacterized membrane protein YsdA (DUF1294 family)/cold shock CspA family protein [Luteimonas terrae]